MIELVIRNMMRLTVSVIIGDQKAKEIKQSLLDEYAINVTLDELELKHKEE